MERRWELIQFIINAKNYESYLEIGTRNLYTFDKIEIPYKVGIDPKATNIMNYWISHSYKNKKSKSEVQELFRNIINVESDRYFELYPDKFDIIFIDGAHNRKQVMKDILNSLDVLNKDGTIVCHDVNVIEERYLDKHMSWNAWEAFAELRMTREDLFMFATDIDLCGIIQKGKQKLFKPPKRFAYTWKFLNKYRKQLLNVFTENEVREYFL